MPRAWIVTDLGWGDSGKGTTVDFLVRETGAKLVVRWNGGAQAGHRVVTDDGRAHVFAQFGAGTFVPGVRTHLAETVLFDPLALAEEARVHLIPRARARVAIAESARVITPYHVVANRLRELARGDGRHGSCGCGIGETVRDELEHPTEVVRARHLRQDRASLARRLDATRVRMRGSLEEEIATLAHHLEWTTIQSLFDPSPLASAAESIARAMRRALGETRIVPDGAVDRDLATSDVVLEGAQGVLLDQDVGMTPPHVTWSRCTSHAAHEWLDAHGFDGERITLGVMRTYATRHGEGPFPTEAPELRRALPEAVAASRFQGPFRVGRLDLDRLRYAVEQSPVDALVVTHLDRLGVLEPPRSEHEWLAWISSELRTPVAIASRGPRASDKRWVSISP